MYQDDHTDTQLSSDPLRTNWTEYQNPSTAVVEAVAEAKGCDQRDLDPLFQYVDGDDVDSLVGDADTALEISFTYEGAEVSVSAAGPLTVRLEE